MEIEKIESLIKENNKKTEIISYAAHQLRTSLSAIKWVLGTIIEKEVGDINEKQEILLKKARESNERMVLLVNDLLLINKIDNIINKFDFEFFPITDIIEQIIFEFSSFAKKRKVEIKFIQPQINPSLVKIDVNKIRSVLQNLLENAIKYSNENSVVLIEIEEKDFFVNISVKDTGIGVPEKDRDNIFNKFFRADNATQKDSGTGLGLYTVKKIIDNHGGKVSFKSSKENGSIFMFTLPTK